MDLGMVIIPWKFSYGLSFLNIFKLKVSMAVCVKLLLALQSWLNLMAN